MWLSLLHSIRFQQLYFIFEATLHDTVVIGLVTAFFQSVYLDLLRLWRLQFLRCVLGVVMITHMRRNSCWHNQFFFSVGIPSICKFNLDFFLGGGLTTALQSRWNKLLQLLLCFLVYAALTLLWNRKVFSYMSRRSCIKKSTLHKLVLTFPHFFFVFLSCRREARWHHGAALYRGRIHRLKCVCVCVCVWVHFSGAVPSSPPAWVFHLRPSRNALRPVGLTGEARQHHGTHSLQHGPC